LIPKFAPEGAARIKRTSESGHWEHPTVDSSAVAMQSRGALATKQQIEDYLRRKAEVTQDDHQAFQEYLSEKTKSVPDRADAPPPKPKFNRAGNPHEGA
jgi:hypothetical protein